MGLFNCELWQPTSKNSSAPWAAGCHSHWSAGLLSAPSCCILNSMWRTAAPTLHTAIDKKLNFKPHEIFQPIFSSVCYGSAQGLQQLRVHFPLAEPLSCSVKSSLGLQQRWACHELEAICKSKALRELEVILLPTDSTESDAVMWKSSWHW